MARTTPSKPKPDTDPVDLMADILLYFRNKEAMEESPHSRDTYRDNMIRAENRLRKAVGLPIVAVKSKY